MTHIITYPVRNTRRRSRTLAALFLAAPAGLFIALAPVDGVTEDIKLDDGTVCTVIEQQATGSGQSGLSTSVTAGSGQVSSSTTLGAETSGTTASSGAAGGSGAASTSGGSAGSSSSASAATSNSGAGGGESLSTASITRPDGSVITRRSDGTCAVTKPKS